MSDVATHGIRKLVDYQIAQEAQRAIVELRRQGRVSDILWLLEHPPTITWGSSGGREHLLLPEETLRARGIRLVPSERGGDATFHEPGQLVGYLIVDLRGEGDRDMHVYLRAVEEGLIRALEQLGIRAERVEGRTGVWVPGAPPRKIAAMGVRAKGWITSHGFALNVQNKLEGFGFVVPCGIPDAGVTSIERELANLGRELGGQSAPPWDELETRLHAELSRALRRPLRVLRGEEGCNIPR